VAELTDLDLECLEYQTGHLSGFLLTSSGDPEQTNRYASRYAIVLAALGRMKESNLKLILADASAQHIGLKARRAWSERPLASRLTATPAAREQWEADYTQSLFAEADERLNRLAEYTTDFRAQMAPHYTKPGSLRGKRSRTR
jgi:hypothetical protein